MSPRISVVIPNWNGRPFLGDALEALKRQSFTDFETIVVDNASTDDSTEVIRAIEPEAVLIEMTQNRGFATAVNAGIRVAQGDAIALLNNDAVPEEGWLGALLACLERHPRAAASTSKLVTHRDRSRIDGAGDIVTNYLRAYSRGRGEQDTGQFDVEVEVFGASGAASLWKRSALDETGLLDEDLFAYYEDVDLSFRARLLGYEVWFAPEAVVSHRGAATAAADAASFVHYHAVRNRWSLLIKDVPLGVLVPCTPRVLFAEALSLARALREGHLGLVLSAYLDVIRALPRWLHLRRERQRTRLVQNDAIRGALIHGYPSLLQRAAKTVRGHANPA